MPAVKLLISASSAIISFHTTPANETISLQIVINPIKENLVFEKKASCKDLISQKEQFQRAE